MINRFLHALTNRQTLSANPIFISDPEFQPAALSPAQVALRAALCLDDASTDYYLKAYSALMNIFPDIDELLQDPNRSYRIEDFLPEGIKSEGGKLISNQTQSGFYLDVAPVVFPVPMTYVIKYETAMSATLLQVETGNQATVPVIAMTDSVTSTLQVNWPDYWPFRGGIELDAAWGPATVLTFTVEPSRFPYLAALARLEAVPAFQTLLLNQNITTLYHTTVVAVEQLAIALAAIALDHPTLYRQTPTSNPGLVDAGLAAAANDFGTTGNAVTDDVVYYPVKYTAGDGGYVTGNTEQLVMRNSVALPVTAVPAAGFAFTTWSDGSTKATRQDLKITQSLSVTANFIEL